MKKKLFVSSSLVVFGLLLNSLSAVVVLAEENVSQVLTPTTRATVVRQEFTLKSGEYKLITINTTNKPKFSSKVLLKIKAENPNNDYFGLEHSGKGDELLFNDSSTNVYKYSSATDEAVEDKVSNGSMYKITR